MPIPEMPIPEMPEPGTKAYDDMVDYMRAEIESPDAYRKVNEAARTIETALRESLKMRGRDFDTEFKKWKEKNK